MAFIYTKEGRQGISSYDMERLKNNDDGSITFYFGPKAPKGLENNWIPTAGKRPAPFGEDLKVIDSPESQQVFAELGAFLLKYLK